MHVAEAAIPPLGDGDLLARQQQLVQHFSSLGICNDGAHRHLQHDVVALDTEHVRALTVLATMGLETPCVAEIHQGVQTGVRHSVHVTATATVSTIGATKLFVFLMPERGAAVAAIARSDFDRGFVYKFHDMYSRKKPTQKARMGGPFAIKTSPVPRLLLRFKESGSGTAPRLRRV